MLKTKNGRMNFVLIIAVLLVTSNFIYRYGPAGLVGLLLYPAILVMFKGLFLLADWISTEPSKNGLDIEFDTEGINEDLSNIKRSVNEIKELFARLKKSHPETKPPTSRESEDFYIGQTVIVFDRYRFAIPLKATISQFADDGVKLRLLESNNIKYPVGCEVWVHKSQIRAYVEPLNEGNHEN